MDKDENRVFYLTDSDLVYSYGHYVVQSIPSGMEGKFITNIGETLEDLKKRYADIVLITESEALEFQSKRKI
ncbi:hypothetical protein Z597_24640 [Salmonella enterica]|nr:hypothetical protein [Salmonella enterica]EAW7866073.1 hypothetical protein [Salmonella enterica]EAY4734459.1 hypothetical protein [Salmonella enterica]